MAVFQPTRLSWSEGALLLAGGAALEVGRSKPAVSTPEASPPTTPFVSASYACMTGTEDPSMAAPLSVIFSTQPQKRAVRSPARSRCMGMSSAMAGQDRGA